MAKFFTLTGNVTESLWKVWKIEIRNRVATKISTATLLVTNRDGC